MATQHDFVLYLGYAWTRTMLFEQSPGVPLDLTSYTVAMVIKDVIGGNTLQTLTSGSGLTITPTAGSVVATITADQSSAWNLTACAIQTTTENQGTNCCNGPQSITVTGPAPVYVLNLTDPSGNESPWLIGNIGVGTVI